jgi:cell wall-associated NlpC family hydrolase
MVHIWCKILILLGFAAFLNAAVAQNVIPSQDTLERDIDTAVAQTITLITKLTSVTKVDSLIQHAYSFIGDRYRRGGTSTKGFDCSGYTMIVFKKFDIKLPHTSAGQGLVGVEVNKTNIKKGDLILFKGRGRRNRRIGHVGIVISEKGEPVRFIHSSTSDGVRIDRLEFDYYRKRYVKAVRLPELYK